MNYSILIIVLICFNPSLVISAPRRRHSATIQKFHRTGEAIAVDGLIKQYEREHQQFYKKLTEEGNHLEWPALDNENLSNYCKKYLQFVVPARTNDNVIGGKMKKMLHYKKENMSITIKIVIVQCKILYKVGKLHYYITRAPEPNCVYALKCSGNWAGLNYTIIYKHCNFEDKLLKSSYLKRKKIEMTSRIHLGTGQPIAIGKYLLKYELEHQEMHAKRGGKGGRIQSPHPLVHDNLNLYCDQYLSECCPNRKRKDASGKWTYGKLHYEILNTEDVGLIIVTCILPPTRHYHTTRASETNCVYALLRKGYKVHDPFIIINKHCDFECLSNDQLHYSRNNDIFVKNIIHKNEVKDETSVTREALSIFPKD